MAFTDEHKKEHITELQNHLYVISHNDERIPSVMADGFYGKDTVGAVKAFQRSKGLETTGETDSATWRKIADQAALHNALPVMLDIFPEDFVLIPESTGYLVYIIQVLMNILSREYDNLPEVEINGFYSPQMNEAVIRLKEISGTEESEDGIGIDTWNILAKKANSKDFSSNILK